jgi:calcium-dependent protein kinase
LAVLAYIANHLRTKESETMLRDIFMKLDSNGDGVVTTEELKQGYKEYMGEFALFSSMDISDVLQKVDFNDNGVIDYGEFITAASSINEMLSLKHLRNAFDVFDIVTI